MIFPIALLLFSLSGNDPDAAETSPAALGPPPSQVAAPTPPPVLPVNVSENDARGLRADPSTQLLYSTLGGGAGILGGGFLGGAIGAGMSSESDGWAAIGNVIFGVGLGVLVGGTTGATWGAVLARPKQPDRSFVPTALGGLGGLVLGYMAGITVYNKLGSENPTSAAFCLLAVPALGAGAGATMIDQWTTPQRISGLPSNPKLGLAPWMPKEGLVGMRLSIPTGI